MNLRKYNLLINYLIYIFIFIIYWINFIECQYLLGMVIGVLEIMMSKNKYDFIFIKFIV